MAEETPKPAEGTTPDATPEPEVHTLPTDSAPTPQADAVPVDTAPAPQADATPVDAAPAPGATPVGQPQPATSEQPPAPDAQPVAPQPVFTNAAATMPPGEKPGDTAPLVLGILSIVLSGLIGLILGIIGLSKSKKVLAVLPDSGKAKGGKITSIIGIVLSILMLIFIIAMVALGCSLLGNPAGAADEAVAAIVNPSEEERAEITDMFEDSIESTGYTMEELGLSSDDFTSWMFDSASYTQTGVQVVNSEAVVTYEVTSNKYETLMDAYYDGLSNFDYSSISSYSEIPSVVGGILKDAMDSSTPSTKTIDVYVSNDGSGWAVSSSEMSRLLDEIYYYD